jgi:hypothetical protein
MNVKIKQKKKQRKVEKDLVRIDNRLVWAVTDGVRVLIAWARDGKSSLTVANEMIENWKNVIDEL